MPAFVNYWLFFYSTNVCTYYTKHGEIFKAPDDWQVHYYNPTMSGYTYVLNI